MKRKPEAKKPKQYDTQTIELLSQASGAVSCAHRVVDLSLIRLSDTADFNISKAIGMVDFALRCLREAERLEIK